MLIQKWMKVLMFCIAMRQSKDFRFILPYILEYPIFSKEKILDVRYIDLYRIKLVEVTLKNSKYCERSLLAFDNFYNICYKNGKAVIKFIVPQPFYFICDIINNYGIDGLSKETFKMYVEFWEKKKPRQYKPGLSFYSSVLELSGNNHCSDLSSFITKFS